MHILASKKLHQVITVKRIKKYWNDTNNRENIVRTLWIFHNQYQRV